MKSRHKWSTDACRNCGDATPGRFCPSCGQRKSEVRVTLRRMLADVLEDQLSIDATLPRTLIAILFRPGHLTNEYLKGRIVSWIPPFRLYLAASVLFFLVLSIQSRVSELRDIVTETADTTMTALDSLAARPMREVIDSLALQVDEVVGQGQTAVTGTPVSEEEPAPRELPTRPGFLDITIEPDTSGGDTPWTDRLVVHTGIPGLNRLIRSRFEELGDLPMEEVVQRIVAEMLGRIPTAMFVLLPVFALLLKLFYILLRRYYVEHFVFALHYHAFAFLTFTLMVPLQGTPLIPILAVWLGVYLWIALKRVYGQSVLGTTFKWIALSMAYLTVLSIGLGVTLIAAVVLL